MRPRSEEVEAAQRLRYSGYVEEFGRYRDAADDASRRFAQEAADWVSALSRDTPTMRNEIKAMPRFILPVRPIVRRLHAVGISSRGARR